MTVTLILLAGMMAVIVGWLIRQTTNVSPWVADTGVQEYDNNRNNPDQLQADSVKIGLGVFLAVATSLFALFISAYMMRMELADWSPLNDPDILWFNTAFLVVASVYFQLAHNSVKRLDANKVRTYFLVAGIFTFIFLIGQLEAWRQLSEAGYYLSNNPANAFFYLFTAVHGLHLFGGLWVWCKTTLKFAEAKGKAPEVAIVARSVELCTIYWHFLLVVWLVLFALFIYT